MSVLVWGWGKKKTNPGFGKYCVPLPYPQSTKRMILATTKGVFVCQRISLNFE
jgi:hypothetical protein